MRYKQFIEEMLDRSQGMPTGTDLPNHDLPDWEPTDPTEVSPVFDMELDQPEDDLPITEMLREKDKAQLIEIVMMLVPDLERNYLELASIDELKRIIELNKSRLDENLRKWFKEKWVRFGPDGRIRGSCARGSESEGKPKCLPQAKAHALGVKGRKYAASKKRREDPDANRTGAAINVSTKKTTKEAKLTGPYKPRQTAQEKFKAGLRARGFDPDKAAERLKTLLDKQAEQRKELNRKYAELDREKDVSEATKPGVKNPVFSGWLAMTYQRENAGKKFPSNVRSKSGRDLNKIIPQDEFDINDIEIDDDSISMELSPLLYDNFRLSSAGGGAGQGFSEHFYQLPNVRGFNMAVELGKRLLAGEAAIKRWFESHNQSLRKIGLPEYKVECWGGITSPIWHNDDTSDVIADLDQLRAIYKGQAQLGDFWNKGTIGESMDQGVAEGRLNEFDSGEGGFGPFKVYQGNSFIEEFSSLDAARDEIDFLTGADPKSANLDWRIEDGTGRTVWQHDPGEIYDRMRSGYKVQFNRPDSNGITERKQSCPECGGLLVEFSELNEKKDACYYKVKRTAKVWPSAYASGRLVQCRKKGAKNWGNKS